MFRRLNFISSWLEARRFVVTTNELFELKALFDTTYYAEIYPDVAAVAGQNLFAHFMTTGWLEGRNPSEKFNTIWYQYANDCDDLNPFVHFIRTGRQKGAEPLPTSEGIEWRRDALTRTHLTEEAKSFLRSYLLFNDSKEFDADFYKNKYSINKKDMIEFFIRSGRVRQHNPSPNFDSDRYLASYPDVKFAMMNAFYHYIVNGAAERRSFDGSTNASYFLVDEERIREWDDISASLVRRPLISVVVPIYNTDITVLVACIESVLNGYYENFELILVDDASPNRQIKPILQEYLHRDRRIKTIFRRNNGNISAATNSGLEVAEGEFVSFLDHDDEFLPDTLLRVADLITRRPEIDVWYSDQLKCDECGVPIDHFFKPDWSPTYLLGVMYVGHVLVVRNQILPKTGFDTEYDGVQDFELMLRLSRLTRAIGHIPHALYKWRSIAGSLAAGVNEKSGIDKKQALAVMRHVEIRGFSWAVENHRELPHRLIFCASSRSNFPSVSIVIPSKDQGQIVERCLDTLHAITRYPSYEVIIVDNGTTDEVALAAFSRHRVKTIAYDAKFNFSEACNLGARVSSGEVIVFLNNDTEIIEGNWLKDLVIHFEDPEVGCVGPVLLYPDERVQHAGIVLGARGTADHVMRFFPQDVDGYAGSLPCAREVSGVTGACLLMKKAEFTSLGEFSEDFAKHYQDVDLCLKVLAAGKRIICVGNVRLIHHESVTRKAEGYDRGDRAILIDRWWEKIVRGDQFYSRHLSLERLDYSVNRS